ncbi:MAG: NADH dehydrogenase [Desulfobulbaceae bacterium DB1]|nr:MAG: NADH dehydrogenase [Desulfobulbaceae bacterium DB1]
MNPGGWLLILILLSSLVPGLIIFALPEKSHGPRTLLNLGGAVLKLLLVLGLVVGIFRGSDFEMRWSIMPGLELVLHSDPLSALFATLSTVLWLLTTVYAVAYLEDAPNRRQFFGYFSVCVTVTVGIALAGNLLTFLLFYELLTLTTYPLVIHRGTREAREAGRVYLAYTLSGGAVIFIAVVWLQTIAGPLEFSAPSVLPALGPDYERSLVLIFILFMAGFGVKAALVPLHGWLPRAMVAPAPVSALLHAVAVVKAGVFGIIRIVHDVYGIEFARQLGLLFPLSVLASISIIYGSICALREDDLKRRLAYSTVSQLSYIVLGISVAGPIAAIGGLVHLVHQGLMKITLFFCAGNLAETLGVHRISRLPGVARRMPLTMAAFTVAALGMIGVPPMVGFVSKWYLGMGGLDAGKLWVVGVLAASSLLNAAYFLPIVVSAWFGGQEEKWPVERTFGRFETHWMLLLPPLVTAFVVVVVGLLANAQFSPLAWVKFIVAMDYAP